MTHEQLTVALENKEGTVEVYALYRDTDEICKAPNIELSTEDIIDLYFNQNDFSPELKEFFLTKEEALEELKRHKCWFYVSGSKLCIDIHYVAHEEWRDGEFVQSIAMDLDDWESEKYEP